MRSHLDLVIAVACIVAAMCTTACDARSESSGCHFGPEHTVGALVGHSADAIATVAIGNEVLAVWSDESGLFARRLDTSGLALGATVRVGERCAGGLALARHRAGARLACLRSGEQEHGIEVMDLAPNASATRLTELHTQSAEAHGIALGIGGNRTTLAWSEGPRGHEQIWSAHVQDGTFSTPHTLSDGNAFSIEPDVLVVEDRVLITWAEMSARDPEAKTGRIMLYEGRGAAMPIAPVACISPTPRLTRDAEGVIVAFRDVRPPDVHAGLYLVRARRNATPTRVARANALGAEALAYCERGLLAATPRTFRGDALVGVSRIDSKLRRIGREVQIYQTNADLALAALSCVQHGALAFVADEKSAQNARPLLRATALLCN